MKLSQVVMLVILGLALLSATSTFAANKGSLNLQYTVSVSGQQLPAGDYSVSWEGTDSNLEINIKQGKKVVAKTTGRIFDLDQPPRRNSTVITMKDDGSRVLSEIRFDGKKQAIALGEAAVETKVERNSTK